VEASDGDAFIVAPLEEVRGGGDYKEAEAVEVGVKEGQDLDDRLCGEEDEGPGKGEAEFGTGEKGGQVRRLRRRDEDWDCDVLLLISFVSPALEDGLVRFAQEDDGES
jgi:hypothetical protein